jgi:hypothetical protein
MRNGLAVRWNLLFTTTFCLTATEQAVRPEETRMTLSNAVRGYETFTRRLAARAIDAMLGAPRRVYVEKSEFVLGAEAIAAPILSKNAAFRR